MRPAADHALWREVEAAAINAGIDVLGVTTVEPFDEVRRSIEKRRSAGQHAGMSFTFRNPRRSTEPRRLLRDAASLVVGARAYLEDSPAPPDETSARVARYAWRDHYADLRAGLDAGAEVLRSAGHRAVVVADQNALVDRAAAHRAGIGWWGRNSNLLVHGAGSWFVLGSIATDAVLPTDSTPAPDGCRTCTRCIDACPTGAIVADGVIDARRCLAWLVQSTGVFPRAHRIALHDRIYGCDDCQDVCPPGRRHLAGDETVVHLGRRPGVDATVPDAWVPVLGLLQATDGELLDRFGRWYIPGREPRYLRRNALIVLGNIGDPADPDHRRVLHAHLSSPDPLLRAHAVWACARLGLDEFVASVADDPDPLVRAEVALAPAVPRRCATSASAEFAGGAAP